MTTNVTDWPERPFDPRCKRRVEIDRPTCDAVRQVVGDWDGVNWEALRGILLNDGHSPESLTQLTTFAVRMHFATRHPAIVACLGGQPHTATNTVVSVQFAPPTNASGPAWSTAALRDELGLTRSSKMIGDFAKAAGVATPERGGKAFKYPHADAVRIMRHAAGHASSEIRRRATDWLNRQITAK